jgi:two-component system response regulator VicR
MASLRTILVVEDNEEVVEAIKLTLGIRWPEAKVLTTGRGVEALEIVAIEKPEIVILDLGLPDISGFDVLKRLRTFSNVPVIVVTVRGDEADIVRGIELGANDYIVKPFRQLELLARVYNQIRSKAINQDDSPLFSGQLTLFPSTHEVNVGLKRIQLTPIESNILSSLLRNIGQVVTHTALATAVWGEYYPGATQSLKVHVRRLRQKLEANPSSPKFILTKAGVGYYLEEQKPSV